MDSSFRRVRDGNDTMLDKALEAAGRCGQGLRTPTALQSARSGQEDA